VFQQTVNVSQQKESFFPNVQRFTAKRNFLPRKKKKLSVCFYSQRNTVAEKKETIESWRHCCTSATVSTQPQQMWSPGAFGTEGAVKENSHGNNQNSRIN